MFLFLRMIGLGGTFPDDFGDTTFPADGFLRAKIERCECEPAADDDDRGDRDD